MVLANALKLPPLAAGATLAVVSPASAAKGELIERGVEHLRRRGFMVEVMPHAFSRGPLYYAGTARERAADLHAALTHDAIDAVIATRGGWGSAELLPLLDAMGTAEALRARPKPFIGYSDHTSLQMWMWERCGLPTIYGPMVAADWSKDDGVDEPSWDTAVMQTERWNVGGGDGLRVLRAGEAEAAEGVLLGGCLAIICEALGTRFALKMEEPTVLFLEDIGVKPYQWDRMLQHLRWAGWMEQVTAVVLGDMTANVREEEMPLLQSACLHALRDFKGPVLIGLRSGHVDRRNVSVPLGVKVRVEGADLRALEG